MKRVKSPDGLEWEVRAVRFRLPAWRQNDFDPWDYTTGVLDGLLAFLVLLPFFMIILPFATFVAELPIAVARGLFTSPRWVEAVTWYPQTIRITWRIADRRKLAEAYDRILQQLVRGYDQLEVEGAKIVEMTEPLGIRDLSA